MSCYYIDSDNVYLTLAVRSLLKDIDTCFLYKRKIVSKILILSGKYTADGLFAHQWRYFDEYDMILCCESYYKMCKDYIPSLIGKVINLDNDVDILKTAIANFHNNVSMSVYPVQSTSLSLDYYEAMVVSTYIEKVDCIPPSKIMDRKLVSKYKRALMSRLGFNNNAELYFGVNFLFFLGCFKTDFFISKLVGSEKLQLQPWCDLTVLTP